MRDERPLVIDTGTRPRPLEISAAGEVPVLDSTSIIEKPSGAYVLPAGLTPGPLLPPMSVPVTPVVVPEAGLPPEPALPPKFDPLTPAGVPSAGVFPDGMLPEAAGTVGAGAGVEEVVLAGGGGSNGAGAPGAALTAPEVHTSMVRAAPAKDATATEVVVVVLIISPR